MTGKVRMFSALAVSVLASACGQPNASDIPGAGAVSSTPTPTPTAIVSAAAVTTPCTHGETKTTPNGVKIHDAKCGIGAEAARGSRIEVKYVGRLTSGQVFDSTARHGGKPYRTRIGVGAVIPGWDEGVPGMRVGGVRNLLIPPSLAYGATGAGTIPPNATIEFTIKLLGVKKS